MTRRNRRSTGTTYRLPNGRWRARSAPDPLTGERVSLGTFDSQRAADDALAAAQVDRVRGAFVKPRSGRVLFEHAAVNWSSSTLVRPSTRARDAAYLKSLILPHLGSRPVGQIDPPVLRGWVARLVNDGLASATIVKSAQIVSKVLQQAVDDGLIPTNPMRTVELPKIELSPRRALTDREMSSIVGQLNLRDRAFVLTMGFCGLRPGEAIGLVGSDVSLLKRELVVERTVQFVNGKVNVGPPKTNAGFRTVPVPAPLVDLLSPLVGGPDQLVFGSRDGNYVRLNNWQRRVWGPALEAAGVDHASLHQLRHTAITRWVHEGVDPVTVAKRAGHSSVRTVLDIYARAQDGRTAGDERIDVRAQALIENLGEPLGHGRATVLDLNEFRSTRNTG